MGRVEIGGYPDRCARIVLLLAALVLVPAAGSGQPMRGTPPEVPLGQLSLSLWAAEDGLPSNSLSNVLQSEAGYVWTASYDGLSRFDGIRFELFNRQRAPELAAGTGGFYELVEHAGVLLIGTRGSGVWVYEQGRFRPLVPDQPSGMTVRSLLVDRAGTIWIGTGSRGVLRVEEGNPVLLPLAELAGASVRAILEDREGALWFGAEGAGLTRLGASGLDTWNIASGLASNSVTSLWQDADGVLWIGTPSGLNLLAGERLDQVPELAGVEIYRLVGDDYGTLWLATEQGLYRLHHGSGRVEHLQELRGKPLRAVSAVAFDREGGVWVASYIAGLLRLSVGRFHSYTRRDGLASERINSLYQRRDGSILAGADGGVIHLVGAGGVSRLALPRPLPDVRVRHFLEDRRGRLWVSTYAGLLRIDPGGGALLLTTADGLPTNQVRFTYEDSAGRLWAGTRDHGLLRLHDDGEVEVLDQSTGLASNFIFSLEEDRRGNLVIGSQNGLMLLDADGAVTRYTVADGLPSNVVFNTHVDEEGIIWACGTGGLARLAAGRIQAITPREGLPAESVFDLQIDGRGYAWLSSSRGLIRLDRQSVMEVLAGRRARVEAVLFDQRDGMADSQCTGATAMLRTADGRLWIPTLGGIAVIDPTSVPFNSNPPPVVIDRLFVDGRELAGGQLAREPVEIPAGARRITIGFSALSFQAPSRVRASYRLLGFDADWVDDSELRRNAVYTNLPPGERTFQVIAANDDGVWNREGATLLLAVQPSWHQRPLLRALLLAILAASLWGAYRWRMAAARERNLRLQLLVSEQRRLEIERQQLIGQLASRNEQLEHLTYAVSHDLKSPLVTIRGFLGLLDKDLAAGRDERVANDMQRIREAVSAMGELLEQLTRLWRVEHSASEPEKLAWSELARQAVDLVAGRLAEQRIEVRVEPAMPTVFGDRVQLLEVLQNLIDNAAKFMGAQPDPRIEIGCRRDASPVVFFVRDNGAGIGTGHRKKVFRLFETIDRSGSGTGIGLAIVKRIIEAHGGRVWVESPGEGWGATFCFTLESGTLDPADAGSGVSVRAEPRQTPGHPARIYESRR